MERVNRFLHDWRVDVEVSKLPPHADLDVRFSYHIKATWEKNRELVELAKIMKLTATDESIEKMAKDTEAENGKVYRIEIDENDDAWTYLHSARNGEG